ncbi:MULTISPECIES: PP2C family protein-serine/threonine phosphatase [unclassified Streptomyces]|uniref:PP2C family protein-serine/threonine phosphatase n=1 Tax=unclassified Streptomyces TaxID=2593676 RepID=UPI002E31BEBC|nr:MULTISPECIES: PP2C family protein-serine/threonine phosphatase [unclassified Streptomyces]WUC66725.1 serine/threonine-protein phosphatase [Streptomyces sp. NBC_00539]
MHGREEPGWLRGAPPPRWARAAPLVALVVLTCVQWLTPHVAELGYFLAALPAVAAFSYGATGTAAFAVVVLVLLGFPQLGVGHARGADLATVATVGLLSVVIAWVRRRRDAQLVSVRTVAEAAQLALLPPVPERVGRVRCDGLYRAAQRGTLVGGDLFDVRAGPYGVRALVGDVQGHGLAAVGTVAALLGAFREAVLDDPGLEAVAARLDRRLVQDASNGGEEHPELFTTAVLLEFPPERDVVRIVSCGHPPVLLLRDFVASELAAEPGPPLGLGLAGPAPTGLTEVPLLPGDRLLVHTDGVTEARDAAGHFYPLAQRVPVLVKDPEGLPRAVWRDLLAFTEGGPRDDVAVLVLSAAGAGAPPD